MKTIEVSDELYDALADRMDPDIKTFDEVIGGSLDLIDIQVRYLSEQRQRNKQLARALVTYANCARDSHPGIAFFGNDARDALAAYLGVDVKELEPGSETARLHLGGL